MDTGVKTYQVDKHKQLIPLNGSTVNFSCFFEVKSKDKKSFNIAVVEQGDIKPKQYKLVEEGYINGQIESDNQLKSYFLILKSQQPCECDVRVVVKPKEPGDNPPQQPHHGNDGHHHNQPHSGLPPPQNVPSQVGDTTGMVATQQESYFQFKYIVGVSLVIIIAYFIYKYRKTISKAFKGKDRVLPSISTSFS
jgi:hypothetical protein